MNLNGADVYEPSRDECEALARRFHPDFEWSMLRDDERKGLLDEWRNEQLKREPPKQTRASVVATPVVTEADFLRVVETVKKLAELQPAAANATAKASAHLVIKTVGRVLRPILTREQQQRAEIQRDLLQMRREWGEQARRHNDLFSGLLAELCLHKRDENDARAERLDELEQRIDAAIAELSRR